MSRITIDTLQSKVEFIILSLGGKPDSDFEENKKNQDEFDNVSGMLKEKMNDCKTKLKERNELIAMFGF